MYLCASDIISFYNGCADRDAQADVCPVCLIHNRGSVLLVLIQERTFGDAEARIVAEAIAAFQFNNERRYKPLTSMTIPCITMFRTRPTFYLVPVDAELNKAVISGQYPKRTTRVLRCVTVTKPSALVGRTWNIEGLP